MAKNIRSYSFEGSSVVVVEFVLTIDPNRAVQDVRDKVAGVQGRFRREIGVPTVNQVNPNDDPDDDGDCRLGQRQPAHADHPSPTRWCASACKPCPAWAVAAGGRRQARLRVHIDPYRMQALGLDTPKWSTPCATPIGIFRPVSLGHQP